MAHAGAWDRARGKQHVVPGGSGHPDGPLVPPGGQSDHCLHRKPARPVLGDLRGPGGSLPPPPALHVPPATPSSDIVRILWKRKGGFSGGLGFSGSQNRQE